MLDSSLVGKIVVVLGAGSSGPGWGNGKASAVAFARAGATVIAGDINPAAVEETVGIIREEGGNAVDMAVDVTSADQIKGLFDLVIDRFGRVDVVHYNVGIALLGGCVELPAEEWARAFDVNVTGCFLTCKYAVPLMIKGGGGVVIATGSVAGIRWGGVDYISYSTTKAALINFIRALAMRHAGDRIRAVSILPGLMDTPIIHSSNFAKAYSAGDAEKMVDIRHSQCPTGRMGTAWDVANAAVFLASDNAQYITGTELVVDGGITSKFV